MSLIKSESGEGKRGQEELQTILFMPATEKNALLLK